MACHSTLRKILKSFLKKTMRFDKSKDFSEKKVHKDFFQISKYIMKNHKICSNMDECFGQILNNRKKAVAISRAHAINNPLGMIDNVDFFCFPVSDDVVIYSTVMMFRRNHPLLQTMNEKIRAISESGLLGKWEKENKVVSKSKNSKNNEGGGDDSSRRKLRLDHVQGAFLLLLIGLSVSLVAFVVELFASRLSRNANKGNQSNKFFNAVERLFCHA